MTTGLLYYRGGKKWGFNVNRTLSFFFNSSGLSVLETSRAQSQTLDAQVEGNTLCIAQFIHFSPSTPGLYGKTERKMNQDNRH